ncbi:hypothetical protein QUF70_04925 [Desulfobacterales bacterium HSG17]|nr:hypothetical protein [Desulfobacterales bacterium HSG17]
MNELMRQIVNETETLASGDLIEVLNFIQFIRYKKQSFKKVQILKGCDTTRYLKIMERHEIEHLEDEFKNYKELYPYEH